VRNVQEQCIILAPSRQPVKVGLNFQTIQESPNRQEKLYVITIINPNALRPSRKIESCYMSYLDIDVMWDLNDN
jgi:hypothetical protein